MPNEHDFSQGVNPLCPHDEMWQAKDEQSAEQEVSVFMYSLIRLIKPEFVVETGCYDGETTLFIAKALRDKGQGRLISCDTEADKVEKVNGALVMRGYLPELATVIRCKGIDLIKQCGAVADFTFIDSSPQGKDRHEEASEVLKHIRPLKA